VVTFLHFICCNASSNIYYLHAQTYSEIQTIKTHKNEISGNEALKILSDDDVFLPLQENPRTTYTPYGPYYGGTLCTTLFEISEEIILKLYPPKHQKEEFIQFSLYNLL
jgi:hypothetical protein